ncbi:MAG: hypothetical protein ACR5KV_07630 [Wolbachia sp.]
MDKCDSVSYLIAKNEHSESKQKASQSKFKNIISKLGVTNIIEKKENVVNSSQSKLKTVVSKIKATNILKKKENLVNLSSLSRGKILKKKGSLS